MYSSIYILIQSEQIIFIYFFKKYIFLFIIYLFWLRWVLVMWHTGSSIFFPVHKIV